MESVLESRYVDTCARVFRSIGTSSRIGDLKRTGVPSLQAGNSRSRSPNSASHCVEHSKLNFERWSNGLSLDARQRSSRARPDTKDLRYVSWSDAHIPVSRTQASFKGGSGWIGGLAFARESVQRYIYIYICVSRYISKDMCFLLLLLLLLQKRCETCARAQDTYRVTYTAPSVEEYAVATSARASQEETRTDVPLAARERTDGAAARDRKRRPARGVRRDATHRRFEFGQKADCVSRVHRESARLFQRLHPDQPIDRSPKYTGEVSRPREFGDE